VRRATRASATVRSTLVVLDRGGGGSARDASSDGRRHARVLARDFQNTLVFRAFVSSTSPVHRYASCDRKVAAQFRARVRRLTLCRWREEFAATGVDSRKNRD